ncbi:MAG TPA: transglycosylase SLT domain-containing protein [Egibacteraceae bacterium]|nr:transglycosylase SLT domain-containing protein [Egibacteraceae bacterium]
MTRLLTVLGLVLLIALAACTADDPDAASQSALTEEPAAPDDVEAPAEDEPATEPEAQSALPPAGQVPVAAEDPAGLARQITAAEQAIRSEHTSEEEMASAGHLQQVTYRRLAANPEWRDEVLAQVPQELHGPVVAHLDASAGLASLTRPQEQLPAWRIVEPPPADELLAYYREAQEVFGVPWEYLAAIHLVETRMGRIQGTSPAGAQGPMQFMPGTWDAYGEGDVNDPRDAILAAGRYLSANGAPGTMDAALFAYNRSDAYVRAITAYAEQMRADPRLYRGFYHWQVYYRTVDGDQLLPVGYDGTS